MPAFNPLSFRSWSTKSKTRILISVAVVFILIGGLVVHFLSTSQVAAPNNASDAAPNNAAAPKNASDAPASGTPICNQPILDSPYSYDGAAGTYTTSGTPSGLPTFGAPDTDFPSATRLIVVAVGDNSADASAGTYQVTNTVVYFEPGIHRLASTMYTGNRADYVGGYTAAAGKAIIDGVNGGNGSFASKPSSGHNVDNVWEYLTIRNFDSTENDAIMGDINSDYGGGRDDGDVYEYDTIGPNEYGYSGSSRPNRGESSGGGYAINVGNYTAIKHNCLTQNAQGAYNGGGVIGTDISYNEISWNGLGEYPDAPGTGGSPYACGCSGGGKLFYTANATVDYNYVHNNYSAGIWFDFENTGADISHNYVASNWGDGIDYEASYNANISDNTLIGNSWASDGAWPAGVGGGNCNGVTCTEGGGIIAASFGNPQATIYVSNSGGNANLGTISVPNTISVPGCSSHCTVTSRYRGHIWITGNNLVNNFGGVSVYTDTDRYPGDIDQDAACATPLGSLQETNNSTYYQQGTVLETTSADATISERSVVTASGTIAICDDFGKSPQDAPANDVRDSQAPVKGMAVFNMDSGTLLGTVESVTNSHAFTLSRAPGNASGVRLLLSAYGGCGPADYYGGGPGVKSGIPAAYYWDNCMLGSRNVIVSENKFSMDARTVTGCTVNNECGYQQAIAFNAGVPTLMQFFDSYSKLIAHTSGGLGNVWSDNTYSWSGGGPGQWQFEAGLQGPNVSLAQWLAPPYSQDTGSHFTPSPNN